MRNNTKKILIKLTLFSFLAISWCQEDSTVKLVKSRKSKIEISSFGISSQVEKFNLSNPMLENVNKYFQISKINQKSLGIPSCQINMIQSAQRNLNANLVTWIEDYSRKEFVPWTLFNSWEQGYKLFIPPDDPTIRSTLPTKRFLAHFNLNLIHIVQNWTKSVKYCAKIVIFGLPQKDHFIFMGHHNLLWPLLSHPVLQDFKYKFGITFQGHVLSDPQVYNGGIPMEEESNLPNFLNGNRLINLRGRHLKISAAPIPTYITFTRDGQISGGTHYLMLKYFGDKYNYSMEIDYFTVKGTGIFRQGLWNGMTGAVYYKLADLSIMMGGTVERYGVIDFITFQLDAVLFITRPPNAHIKWQAIVYPYTAQTWMCIIICYLSVMLTLYVLLWWVKEPKKYYHSIFIPYQITLDQGFDLPIPDAVKFISALWMFFIVVISTGYRSDLVSYFSFPEPEKIPKDFDTLDFRQDYKVTFNYHAGTAFQYFDSAKFGLLHRIRKRFELEPNTAACAISSLLDAHTVCVTWGQVIGPIISGNLTLPGTHQPTIVYSKPAVTFPIGFAFPKNSILTETFDMLTRYLRDMGLVQQLNRMVLQNFTVDGKAWMKTQKNKQIYESIHSRWKKSQEKVRSFELLNLRAIFIILFIGLVVSMILWGSELIYHFYDKNT